MRELINAKIFRLTLLISYDASDGDRDKQDETLVLC
jgi:hypothetical protein